MIEVIYNDDPTARELAALVPEIDAVADREGIPVLPAGPGACPGTTATG